ncbi:hypothetical protein HID58_012098 [Brassica napus]|nr:hypothetical protein HID58_039631 [Brassica napus]KAH0934981.1 hypothetical protein HID58_012098 [Brassica napus]
MVAKAGSSDRPSISCLNSPTFLHVELRRETMYVRTSYWLHLINISTDNILLERFLCLKVTMIFCGSRVSPDEVAARGVEFINCY